MGGLIFLIFNKKIHNFIRGVRTCNSMNIVEVTDTQGCAAACSKIMSHCQDLSALGFDCEWVSTSAIHRPVALLQLATTHGFCCLFRLNLLQCVPKELKEILSDSRIIKFGISPLHDSNRLLQDYNAQVCSTLDLRFLYPTSNGLAAMAAAEIGVKLNKSSKIKCSNWEDQTLSSSQKEYAAKDAFVAIEIFKKWLFAKDRTFALAKGAQNGDISPEFPVELSRYLDINFSIKTSVPNIKKNGSGVQKNNRPNQRNLHYIARKSPLYKNCFMHAPDGELLCSCDKRKADWYVERGLAEVMPGEPYSIRLMFEPAARAGDNAEESYYRYLKQNQCVVCGASESYLKHSVVPKEYRKHFPNIMKSHQSHDIVLMCISCHHLATQKNEILRKALADYCQAPIATSKIIHDRPLQRVRNSAKALLNAGEVIPEGRRTYLENEIKNYYGIDYLSPEILQQAANLKLNTIFDRETHGFKVVNYFSKHGGGLTELEVLWRTHFLQTMKPQYLPTLWSITHNHARLAALKVEEN